MTPQEYRDAVLAAVDTQVGSTFREMRWGIRPDGVVTGSDRHPRALDRAIQSLRKAGKIRKAGARNGSPIWRLVHPLAAQPEEAQP